MPDYTPPYVPGWTFTSTASAALTGGDLVEVSGNGTVAKTATLAAQKWVGVAAKDAAVNERVLIYGRGIVHESLADGTVTAGDQVTTTSTAGRQVKTLAAQDVGAAFNQAAVNTALANLRGVIGIALTTAADNIKVRWVKV